MVARKGKAVELEVVACCIDPHQVGILVLTVQVVVVGPKDLPDLSLD